MVNPSTLALINPDSTALDMSFAQVLDSLNASASIGSVSSTVQAFLRGHLLQLQAPQDPFPRSTASKTRLESGKAKQGDAAATSKELQSLALQVADRFELDELEALSAVKIIQSEESSGHKLTDDDWDALTAHIFEERACVISIVGLLLRCSEDPDHPCHDLANELLPSIITPAFPSALLASFARRTAQSLPEAVRSSPRHSSFWSKQLAREQKSLLEIVFLVYYTRLPPDGAGYKLIIDTCRETVWGQRQESAGFFDAETKQIVREIGDLLVIIAVEGLSLEAAMGLELPIPEPSAPQLPAADLYHPCNLQGINESIEALVNLDSMRASPVLIAWAFILSKITHSLAERGVPEIYHSFATKSLRVEAAMSSRQSRASTAQPLFQLYTAHALAPASSLFDSLLSTLSSPLFGSTTSTLSDPNVLGYLLVLRSVIVCLPLIFRLSFLSTDQYATLLKVFALLYGNIAAAPLCARFWEGHGLGLGFERGVEAEGEDEIVELARARFPVQFGGFVRTVKALAYGVTGLLDTRGDSEDLSEGMASTDEELASCCSAVTFDYLGNLPILTHIVPPSPALAPLPYELVQEPESPHVSYRATRPIPVSRSMIIPVDTKGRLVSQRGSKPVVISWEIEWSAWKLFGDVLDDYAGNKKSAAGSVDVFGAAAETTTALPIDWDTEEEKTEDVANVLDLFTTVIANDPALGIRLADHLSPIEDGTSIHFVETLFKILERSLSTHRPSSSRLVSSLLGLISALLPSFPGAIWTFLRGSALLFPTASSTSAWRHDSTRNIVVATEKISGTYPITAALVRLVYGLVLEAQLLARSVSAEFEAIKQDVLVRALNWVKDDVWMSYSSWRFIELAEKFELGRSILRLYALVLSEAELTAAFETDQFDSAVMVVVNLLLVKATTASLSPMLFTISAGSDTIVGLRRSSRHADAQAAEDAVATTLALLRKLLQLRRRIPNLTSSLLERLLLSLNTSADRIGASTRRDSPLVEALAGFVTTALDAKLSTQAAIALTLLCIGSNEVEIKSASFVGLLGGSEKSERLAVELLAIVSDPLADDGLQVAVWDFISSIVESQPSFARLLITGKHYPFGSDGEDQPGVVQSEPLGQKLVTAGSTLQASVSPAKSRSLARTAIGVALETVAIWKEVWQNQPALLSAVLRFFDFTWQHLIDFGTALDSFRTLAAPWDAIVKIAFENVGEAPELEHEVQDYCHRMTAKVHAVRILALDIQASTSRPVSKALEGRVAAKALFKALADRGELTKALSGATFSSYAPELHEEVYELVVETIPAFELDSLRRPSQSHPLDNARTFGIDYLYSLPLLRRTLHHLLGDASAMMDNESLTHVITSAGLLNLNHSLLDVQISNSRSWRQLLEIALPLLRRDPTATATILNVASAVGADIANEERGGQIMAVVHSERLCILLTMVEVIQGVASATAKDEVVTLLAFVAKIFTSEILPPLESVTRQHRPNFHRTLFRIAFFAFRKLNAYGSVGQSLFTPEQQSILVSSTSAILRLMITGTRDLLVLARAARDIDISDDLTLAVAVLTQIISTSSVPPASVWLVHCQSVNLFRSAFEVFVQMDELNGRLLYSQQVLDLCLAMAASSDQVAEQMALAGVMTALTNNALAAMAEAGAIAVTVGGRGGQRTMQHEIWTSTLALVVALVQALGQSTSFVEIEVTGFVRLFGGQLGTCMSWNADNVLTLPALEEMQNVAALMHGMVGKTSAAASYSVVTQSLSDRALYLLQQVVYAILHPNHLSTLVEPTNAEEKRWIDQDTSTSDDIDLAKRPVLGAVTHALLQIACTIVDSLLSHSHAFSTLIKDPLEWRVDRAVVQPTATVTASEQTSIGTLFDLSSFCLDLLRLPLIPAPALSTSYSPLPPYSAEATVSLAQHVLEASLLLTTTQLGLWIRQPEQTARAAATIRREISGELAGDLQSLLDKSGHLGRATGDKSKSRGGKSLLGLAVSPVKEHGRGIGVSAELITVLKAFVANHLIFERE